MKTLVLLHGWGMTPAVFDALEAALRPMCAVHAMPLPGYCGSASVSPYTLETLVQDLAARAPQRCCVAGWSLGGQVALEWARAKPQQVQRLALIGSTPSFVRRAGWTHAVERSVFEAFADGMAADRNATLARFAMLQAQGDSAMKAAALRLRAGIAHDASTATLQQGLRVLLDTDLRDVLRAVEQETLVIHGENDRLVPIAAGEHLARELAHARLVTISGAAHAPFIGRVQAVADALRDVLR